MKKVITLLLMIFVSFTAISQTKVTTYKCNGRTYSVYAYYSGKDLVTLVEGNYGTSINTSSYLVFKNEKSLDEFLSCLSQIKAKYIEWAQVAKKNKVTDFRKEIPVTYPKLFICGDKWPSERERDYHEVNVKYATGADFRVDRDGDSFIHLFMRSDWNEYGKKHLVTAEWALYIKSNSQFEGLIKALDKRKLKEKATVKTDLLFK